MEKNSEEHTESKFHSSSLATSDFSDMVAPYLSNSLRFILEPLVSKYGFDFTKQFFYSLALLVFAVSFLFFEIEKKVVIVLSFTTLVSFLAPNSKKIRKVIFPNYSERLKSFIDKIEEKSKADVISFITSESLLTPDLTKILETKHGHSYDVVRASILQQAVDVEFIEYIASSKTLRVESHLMRKALFKCQERAGTDTYNLLVKKYSNNGEVLRALALKYYFFNPDKRLFGIVARRVDAFRNWIFSGSGKMSLVIVSALILYRLGKIVNAKYMEVIPNVATVFLASVAVLGIWFILAVFIAICMGVINYFLSLIAPKAKTIVVQ